MSDTSKSNIPLMVTLREASTMSGLSYDAVRKLCISNQIIHIRAGKKYFVNWTKFIDYLNEGSADDE